MITLQSHLSQIRLLLAYLLSPLVVPFAIYIVSLMAYGIDAYDSDNVLTTTFSSIWYTYILVLIFGAPSLYVLKLKQADSLLSLTITGAVIGLLSAVLMSIFGGSFQLVLYFLFGCSGSLFGALFWLLAMYEPKQTTKSKRRHSRRRR